MEPDTLVGDYSRQTLRFLSSRFQKIKAFVFYYIIEEIVKKNELTVNFKPTYHTSSERLLSDDNAFRIIGKKSKIEGFIKGLKSSHGLNR